MLKVSMLVTDAFLRPHWVLPVESRAAFAAHIKAGRFSQEKVFQDELLIAGGND